MRNELCEKCGNNSLILWFKNSDLELSISFSNDPIYKMQKDLIKQWIEAEEKRNKYPSTYLHGWSQPSIDVNIQVETQDEQLSWKNLDDKTILSEAELTILYQEAACVFRGYLKDFIPGSHFTFHVTHTLHNTDKAIGFSVSENNIMLWTKEFPKELLVGKQ